MRPDLVQRACVLMHFDPTLTPASISMLADDERALLARVDARAFRTDPERPLRLLAALVEEYPVSTAIIGASALPAFISSTLFKSAILRGRLVVDAFGDWLFARAGPTAQLELALALARRKRTRRGGDGIARAPGVEVARVPAGTLAFFARARAELARGGAAPHERAASGARVEAPLATADTSQSAAGLECLLIQRADVSTCAEELLSLLSFARDARPRATLVDEARRLGAGDDAAELVDELLADGLLAPV